MIRKIKIMKDFGRSLCLVLEPDNGCLFYICNPLRAPFDERVGYVYTNKDIVNDFIIAADQLENVTARNGVNSFFDYSGTIKDGCVTDQFIDFLNINEYQAGDRFIIALNDFLKGNSFTDSLPRKTSSIVTQIISCLEDEE